MSCYIMSTTVTVQLARAYVGLFSDQSEAPDVVSIAQSLRALNNESITAFYAGRYPEMCGPLDSISIALREPMSDAAHIAQLVQEFSYQCASAEVARRTPSIDVIERLREEFPAPAKPAAASQQRAQAPTVPPTARPAPQQRPRRDPDPVL